MKKGANPGDRVEGLQTQKTRLIFEFLRVLIMSRKANVHFLDVFIMSPGAKWLLTFMRPHRGFFFIMSRRREMRAAGKSVS